MHIAIERLYAFVLSELDLKDAEQSHLVRCDFCIEWLDACVAEKIAQIYEFEAGAGEPRMRMSARRSSRNRRRC
jgi:hypothetical protein